jgi:ribosome modulation factor
MRNGGWDEEVLFMLRTASKVVLMLILGATPVVVTPRAAYPQTSSEQRAYQAGFQNGQNDRSRNRPMNLTTDNWQGQNLTAYRRGYEDGYRGRGNGPIGAPTVYTTDAERRAYQAGFQNGQNDHSRNKPMNLKTDNWNGQNLTAYQRGYEDGYRGGYRH